MVKPDFRDIGVRTKLYTAFGLLMLILVGIVAIARYNLVSFYETTARLGNETYKKADAANDLIKFALTAANSYRDLALSTDPAENREDQKIIRDSRAKIDATLLQLEEQAGPAERPMLAAAKLRKQKLDDEYVKFFKLLETDRKRLPDFIAQSIALVNDSFVEALQIIEDYEAQQVERGVVAALEQERRAEANILLLGIACMLVAAAASYLIGRNIAGGVGLATEALGVLVAGAGEKAAIATAIAEGDLAREVPPSRQIPIDTGTLGEDEIGRLLKGVAALGDAQAKFDAALTEMTRSLRLTRAEEGRRDWMKNGESGLNALLRGEHEPAAVAENSLRFLAEYLDVGVGAFYFHDQAQGELKLAASYAFTRRKNLGAAIGIGEGLVGQVARERKSICWTQVPADYLQIASSLGEAVPANALALPIQREGQLFGVVELGAFHAFGDMEMAFLEQSASAIAISLNVAESRLRVDALLAETRRQADQLREQQDQLQQSNEELSERARLVEQQKREVEAKNRKIEAVSAEIEAKAAELEQVSAYKSEFLANMSHELRTPLNSMMLLSKLLADNADGSLTAKQLEYASTIHGAGRDLLNLINDILDLSKVEAGCMQFHIDAVVLAELTQSLDRQLRPLAEQKGLDLRIEIDRTVPATLRTDEQRLQQILKNLLANAIKFTAGGSVGLRIGDSPGAANPLGVPALAFAVADTGIGIAAEQRERIFGAFHQADGTTSRRYGGTGLGLSIARQLARNLGGDIVLDSTVGQGSVFTLWLPSADGAMESASGRATSPPAGEPLSCDAPMAAEDSAHRKASAPEMPFPDTPAPEFADDRMSVTPASRSILVVEDDPAFAAVLSDLVRQKGFMVLYAADGDDGMRLAEQYLPSAVLLDIMLPGLDGWGVMRRLKDNPRTRHIPVHVVSCLEERQRALAMGALGYAVKPSSPEVLEAALRKLTRLIERPLKQLLLLEDDRAELEAMRRLFGESDVEIVVAADGAAAIEACSGKDIDCAVVDIAAAAGTGFALLQYLADLDPERRLPVVAYCRRPLNSDERVRLAQYADRVVVKVEHTPERLLDEVVLFLHMVESQLPVEKQRLLHLARDQEAMLAGKKVLLVDDDMRNVYSLSSILADKGMRVVEAENGREALARLEQQPDVDIVLMDIMMPEMDGYAALRAIRADRRHDRIPLLAMTAKALAEDRGRCLEAGADDYISKPLDVEKLFSLLRVWLYERALGQ